MHVSIVLFIFTTKLYKYVMLKTLMQHQCRQYQTTLFPF